MIDPVEDERYVALIDRCLAESKKVLVEAPAKKSVRKATVEAARQFVEACKNMKWDRTGESRGRF